MTRARNSANLASHGNLFVDITNDRTGIGSVVPDQNLHVAGTAGFHADVTFTGDLYNTTWDRSDNSLKFVDNAMAKFGNSADLTIFHDGSHSHVQNGTGDLRLTGNRIELRSYTGGENYFTGDYNGAAKLYYNNGQKFETTAYGTNTTGTAVNDGLVVAGVATVTTMNVTGVLTYDDVTSVDSVGIVTARQGVRVNADGSSSSNFISVGASADLKLFHESGHSRISNSTGILKLTAPSGQSVRVVKPDDSANVAVFHIDAETHLYYNGGHKFSTVSDGIQVVGNATINDSIIHNGDTDTKIRFPADDTIRFETGGATRVGITTFIDMPSPFNGQTMGHTGGRIRMRSNVTDDPVAVSIGMFAAPPSGDPNVGLCTVMLQSNSAKRPELRFDNIHNGNWHESNGNTQYLRLIWTAPNETSTTPEVCEIKPTVSNNASGAFSSLRFRTTDNSTGLKTVATFNTFGQLFFVGTSVALHTSSNGVGIPDNLHHYSDSDTRIRFPANDTITFETAGSERVRIDSTGQVGIGTNLPHAALHISDSHPQIRLTNVTTPNASDSGTIRFTEFTNSFQGMYITYNANTNILHLGRHSSNDSILSNDVNAISIERANSIVTFGSDILIPDKIVHTGDVNTSIRFPANDTITFETLGNERVRIHSNGFMSLGASSAPTKFGIRGNSATTDATMQIVGNGVSTLLLGQDSDGGVIRGQGGNSVLKFKTGGGGDTAAASGGTEVFRIRGSNFLIGTTVSRAIASTHTSRFQIEGTGTDTSSAHIIFNSNSQTGAFLFLGKSRGTSNASNNRAINGDQLGTIAFHGADGTDIQSEGAYIRAQVDGTSGSNDMPGRLIFATTADGSSSATERFRIDSNGHARFGSSGSGSSSDWNHSTYGNTEVAIDGGGGYGALHFRGDGAGSVNTRFSMGVGDDKFYMAYDDVDNRHNIVVKGDGTVGINETNPIARLHVKNGESNATGYAHDTVVVEDSDHAFLTFLTGTSGSSGINFGDAGDPQRGVIQYDHSNDYMRFITAAGERLRIASNGSVTIGKTSNSGKGIEIYDSNNAAIRIQNSHTGTGSGDGLLIETSFSDALIWNYENSNTRFSTNNTERLRIASGGQVEINNAIGTDPWGATGNVGAGAWFGYNTEFGSAFNAKNIVAIFNRTNTAGVIVEYKYNGTTVVGSVITDGTNLEQSAGSNLILSAAGAQRLRINGDTNGRYLGRTPLNPAESAEEIKNDISGTPDNDWYYIKQFGNVARLHYCVFKDQNGNDIAGGPWTMNWIAGVHPNQFSTTGSTALGQYLNLCKGIGIDKPGRGMESSRTTAQVYGAWLAVKRALWDLDPGFFNGATSGGGGVLLMPLLNSNGEGGSSAHRLVYSTSTSTHIPPNENGDHCNANQLFCGWWGGNDFSSWATNNNSVPSPEDWGPGDPPHTGDIGAKSNSTPQKPSWKDLMLVTCVYK